jgi:poly(3-hydroxybutyrate) depolymerase
MILRFLKHLTRERIFRHSSFTIARVSFCQLISILTAAILLSVAGNPCRADTASVCSKVPKDTIFHGGVLVLPKGYTGNGTFPLLIMLHGDEGTTKKIALAWSAACRQKGIVLFMPQCPAAEGCKGSFWKWGGEPTWLFDDIAAVEKKFGTDPAKRFIGGYSGGATYISMWLGRLGSSFKGVVFVSGGIRPDECASKAPPLYYLIGDQDIMLGLAKSAKEGFEQCGHFVTWDLVPGAGHATTLELLKNGKASTIIDWMMRIHQ